MLNFNVKLPTVKEPIKPRSTRGNLCACVIPNSAPPQAGC